MKDSILKTVKDFLLEHLESERPILIGLSGGEDSSALLSLVVECRFFFPLNIHVAHFDHAWREESREEALLLQDYVKSFAIPFHSERSECSASNVSNLEEKAREERFAFFKNIYQEIGAQSLVLAHQMEDQAETVLKRVLEGAGILSLAGMQQRSLYETMSVWRPLLSVSRKEIEAWNQRNSWIPFQDRTNLDLKFLRPRMRGELFPMLEKCFGKEVRRSLFRVGEELSLLKNHLEKRLQSYVDQSDEGLLGSALFFNHLGVTDLFEKREIVRLFLRKHQAVVSSTVLKKVVSLLESDLSDKQLDVSRGTLLIERGLLVWLNAMPKPFEGQISVKELPVSIQLGDFTCEIGLSAQSLKRRQSLLAGFLAGEISYRLKEGTFFSLTSYDLLEEKDQKKISGYLSKNKIPAKMKKIFPFVTNNGRLVDFDSCFNSYLNCGESLVFSNIILKM